MSTSEAAVQQNERAVNTAETEVSAGDLIVLSDDEETEEDAALAKERSAHVQAERLKVRELLAQQAKQDAVFRLPKSIDPNKPPKLRKLSKRALVIVPLTPKPIVSLSGMLQIPLDLVAMILGKLDPTTLLNVAVANKQYVPACRFTRSSYPILGVFFQTLELALFEAECSNLGFKPCYPDVPTQDTQLSLSILRRTRVHRGRHHNSATTGKIHGAGIHKIAVVQRDLRAAGLFEMTDYADLHLLMRVCGQCTRSYFLPRHRATQLFKQDLGKDRFVEEIFEILPLTACGQYYIYESSPKYVELTQKKAALDADAYANWLREEKETVASVYAFGSKLVSSLRRIKANQAEQARAARAPKEAEGVTELARFRQDCYNAEDVSSEDIEDIMEETDIESEIPNRLRDPQSRADLLETIVDRAQQLKLFRVEQETYEEHARTRQWLIQEYRSKFAEPLSLLPPGELYALTGIQQFFCTTKSLTITECRKLWDRSQSLIRKQALRKLLSIFKALYDKAIKTQRNLKSQGSRLDKAPALAIEDDVTDLDAFDTGVWAHLRTLWRKLSNPAVTYFKCTLCWNTYSVRELLQHYHVVMEPVRKSYKAAVPNRYVNWQYDGIERFARPAPWAAELVGKTLELAFASQLIMKAIAEEASDPCLPQGTLLAPPATPKQLLEFNKEWKMWCHHPLCPPRQLDEAENGYIDDRRDKHLRLTFEQMLSHVQKHHFEAQAGGQLLISSRHIEVISD